MKVSRCSRATDATIGFICLQKGHQSASNSSTTGNFASNTSVLNVASVMTTGFPSVLIGSGSTSSSTGSGSSINSVLVRLLLRRVRDPVSIGSGSTSSSIGFGIQYQSVLVRLLLRSGSGSSINRFWFDFFFEQVRDQHPLLRHLRAPRRCGCKRIASLSLGT